MSKPRLMELRRRQRRKRKLKELRQQYEAENSKSAREKILEKMRRLAPTVDING